jgi:hypothetical protein
MIGKVVAELWMAEEGEKEAKHAEDGDDFGVPKCEESKKGLLSDLFTKYRTLLKRQRIASKDLIAN